MSSLQHTDCLPSSPAVRERGSKNIIHNISQRIYSVFCHAARLLQSLSSRTTVSFRRRIKTPPSFTSTSATKREIPYKNQNRSIKQKMKKRNKTRKQNNQTEKLPVIAHLFSFRRISKASTFRSLM